MRLYVLCAINLAACAFEPSGPLDPGDDVGQPDPGINGDVDAANVVDPPSPDAAPTPPPIDAPEPPTLTCRIEGENLGIVGAKVTTDTNREYTFIAWESNAAGAYIGFRLQGPSSNLRYEVRTSNDTHTGDTLVYTDNERIMRVDFCVGGDS